MKTKKVHTFEALKTSDKKMDSKEGLEALFTFATEGILVANKAGEIVKINPATEKMFGYSAGELFGKKIETLLPRRVENSHMKSREGFNKNPHPRSMGIGMDLYGRRKDDSEFPVEISLSPFNTKDGSFVIAFIIDITIRKKNDDYIKKQKAELEILAIELKKSNEELENFAYISSHDLQEPLRKIQSFGDRLKTMEANNFSEKGLDYLNRIINAADRMSVLINDLLLFSRLNSRAQPFEKVNLNTILKEVLSDMEVSIEKTKAKIEIEPLPSIDAEPLQMRQLFQNMISNAIKFRKENEIPVIKIFSGEISEQGRQLLEISFSDNGIGFDEKYNDRIFNIFQRLEGQKYEGSGIGLSVCKKIANRHGGNITAKSKTGTGSTFLVTLAIKHNPNH
jgi:two-component system sensor kinase FixL